MTTFITSQIPLRDIDKHNRKAAASGSISVAIAAGDADWNGHHITVAYRPHAVDGPHWVAEYYWGERVVLGRGSFHECLCAALEEYRRGHRGCAVAVYANPQAPDEAGVVDRLCTSEGMTEVPYGENPWDFASNLSA